MRILGFRADDLIGFAELGIDRLRVRCGVDRNYGYLTVFDDVAGGDVMLIAKIHVCPPGKAKKYFALSQEKATRLHSHDVSCLTSYQSRSVKKGMWGGAIRAMSVILSFSGLPELADEALVIFIAHSCRWITRAEALALAAISNNPYVEQIL